MTELPWLRTSILEPARTKYRDLSVVPFNYTEPITSLTEASNVVLPIGASESVVIA